MTDVSDQELLEAWLQFLHKQQRMTSAKPEDEDANKRREELFAKLLGQAGATAGVEKSHMLDSLEMESFHAVDHLARKPDGTTVIPYYFTSDSAEASGVCQSEGSTQLECTAFLDERTRKLAREVMSDIVAESGARIEFREVFSKEQAFFTFVKSSELIKDKGAKDAGYASRVGNENYVVDAVEGSTADLRTLIERELNMLSPEKKETFRRGILEEFGRKYGDHADIATILISEAEKRVIAHEIEHTLGAKHPDDQALKESNGDLSQTIMSSASGLGKTLPNGQILGSIDIEWYRRHFGVNQMSEGDLSFPAPSQANKLSPRHER